MEAKYNATYLILFLEILNILAFAQNSKKWPSWEYTYGEGAFGLS